MASDDDVVDVEVEEEDRFFVKHPENKSLSYTIDMGVDYECEPTETVERIINNAYDKGGVSRVVLLSNGPREWTSNLQHIENVKHTFITLGCHPHNAKSFITKRDIARMQKILDDDEDRRIVAIGLCGLDYERMFSKNHIQCKVFRDQVVFARRNNMPLYIHCRGKGAYEDIMWILEEEDPDNEIPYGFVHCFSGNLEQALKWTSMGYVLGVSGLLFDKRRNRDMYHAVCHPDVPLDKLLVQSNAPHLGIYPRRYSEPSDTQRIVRRLAYGRLTFGMKDANKKERDKVGNPKAITAICRTVYENSYRFLGLSDDASDDDVPEDKKE